MTKFAYLINTGDDEQEREPVGHSPAQNSTEQENVQEKTDNLHDLLEDCVIFFELSLSHLEDVIWSPEIRGHAVNKLCDFNKSQ